MPNAVADTNSIAEDVTTAITGDVLTNDLHPNDQPGADVPTSFVSWDSTVATYGTFTDTGNGTYSYVLDNTNPLVQGLDAGETLTETFDYTMQDADGDTDTATLTITINGTNDGPHITTDPGNVEGTPDTVYESGLAAGSDAAAASEFASGTFTVSDPDGLDDIQSVTINGMTIPIASLGTANPINVINGANGTLTVTAYDPATGIATYTYELTTPTTDLAGDETNVFTLTTSDGTSTSAPATITINIADDMPNAVADGPFTVTVDTLSVTGNVLTDGPVDDSYGADGPAAVDPVVWLGPSADDPGSEYGTLTTTGAGYTYDLNTSNEAVKNLDTGESIDVHYNYMIKDADGDISQATLTIRITGTNDGPTISLNPTDDTVYESGLPTGSDAGANTEFAYGTFTISDSDGLSDVQSVTINGTTVLISVLDAATAGSPVIIHGTNGDLSITDYDNTTGVAQYTYELKTPATDGAGDETDVFSLTVTDGTATSAPATLTIGIIDDIPTAYADTNSAGEGAIVTGNVLTDGTDDVFGADGPTATTPAGGVVGVRAAAGDTTTPVVTGTGTIIDGLYGKLTLQADGSYSYDGNPDAITSAQSDVFVYTIKDADGDLSTTTLTINLTDSGLMAPADNDVLVHESALDTALTGDDDSGDLAVGTATGSLPNTLLETDADNQLNASGGTGPYTYELVGSATGSYGTIQINSDGSYTYTLTKPYDTTPDADNGMHTEENMESFTYKVTDANGNTAQGTITVDIVDDIPTALPAEYTLDVLTPATTAVINNLAAGWVEPFDPNVDNKIDTDTDDYYEQIEWGGNLDGKYVTSNYIYTDNASLTNVNVGETFNLGTFTHNNFPIPGGSGISTAYLKVTFDVLIDGQTIHVDHVVEFQHEETPNDGSHPDDIVTIVNGTDEAAVVTPEGFKYTLKIGFQDAEGNTVVTVDTKENASNTFNMNAILTADADQYVPPVTGTIDANFGADGPADVQVVSFSHDLDGNGSIDSTEVYTKPSDSDTLSITTHEGGTFSMNFLTGEYTYTASTGLATGTSEVFSYTVKDADGDTASSTLTFNLPVENVLVVGTNVNDQTGQTTDHYIDHYAPLDGPITGGAGSDVLVGDIGGANSIVQPGQNYNISLIVDSSGSMDKDSGTAGYTRMALAQSALKNLADQLVGHDGIINLQIIDFDSNVVANISWSQITSANLSAIYAAIDNMVAEGATNYEAGFNASRAWLSSQTNGYENITFFLTDGNPTYYINSYGNVAGPGNVTDYSTMLNSVQAFALLSPISHVEAIGIGSDINENYLKFFDNTDVTGTGSVSFWNGTVTGPVGEVEIVNTAEELSAALQHGSSEYTLLGAGDDHLVSGDGDDVIFGDSVHTDALADANSLTTADGAGWEVFEKLGWTEDQIVNYINEHHAALSAESGRTGGNDIIDGGAGNDIIYGQEGNDILSGGTGDNIIKGGSGADTFVVSEGGNDTILDYNKTVDGDKVDISSIVKVDDEAVAKTYLNVREVNGKAVLDIYDGADHSAGHLKASVTFDNINYSDLGSTDQLDNLLGQVDIDHHS